MTSHLARDTCRLPLRPWSGTTVLRDHVGSAMRVRVQINEMFFFSVPTVFYCRPTFRRNAARGGILFYVMFCHFPFFEGFQNRVYVRAGGNRSSIAWLVFMKGDRPSGRACVGRVIAHG